MSEEGKLSLMLRDSNTQKKKLFQYARSKKLDYEDLLKVGLQYSVMTSEFGPELSPLHVACIASKPETVAALVKDGLKVNAENGFIASPLRIALDKGNISVARLLLELGADAKYMNDCGSTPIVNALSNCSKREKTCISAVRLLLEAGVSVNSVADKDIGAKPLHIAVDNNMLKLVSFLLQRGADGDAVDIRGSTPLLYACSENRVEIIKLLTLHKVDFYRENERFETPLMLLTKTFNIVAFDILIKAGCDINKELSDGSFAPLHMAVEECNLEKVKFLVSRGANPNKQLKLGETALHLMAQRERNKDASLDKKHSQACLDITEFLVDNGADLNLPDNMGNMPIAYAIENGHLKLAKLFIKLGASLNLFIPPGSTLLHGVVQFNCDIILTFLEYGVDYNKRSHLGKTAYHTAIVRKVDVKFIKGFVEWGCPYNQDIPIWNQLVMNCNQQVEQFFNAEKQFFKGIKENNLNMVKTAIKNGAVPTGRSEGLKYPLHFLAFKGFKELLVYLLENNFPANDLNDEGETALFVAAKQGNLNICRSLLQFGASYNYSSKKCPKTPKMIASEFKHEPIVSLFQSVNRMYYLASLKSNCIVKELKKALKNSLGEYLMFVNAVNKKGETLLSSSLRFKHYTVSKKMMALRINISAD